MKRSHGQSLTRFYRLWRGMRTRCENPNAESYANYGARGIQVCERWKTFELFLEDMGPRPQGTSLERRNNELGYTPDNCYWATPFEQSRNKRDNRLLTVHGVTQPLCVWAEALGTDGGTIRGRLLRGWTVERACTTPISVGVLHSKTLPHNRWLTAAGETLVIAAWDSRLGAASGTVAWRIKLGWSVERACTTPVKVRKNNFSLRKEV